MSYSSASALFLSSIHSHPHSHCLSFFPPHLARPWHHAPLSRAFGIGITYATLMGILHLPCLGSPRALTNSCSGYNTGILQSTTTSTSPSTLRSSDRGRLILAPLPHCYHSPRSVFHPHFTITSSEHATHFRFCRVLSSGTAKP